MMIRCPKCDRVGYLPDRLGPRHGPYVAGDARPISRQPRWPSGRAKLHRGADDSWRGAAMGPSTAGPSRQILGEGIFGRFDEPATTLRTLGPGDSNYEMTFSLDDTREDSGSNGKRKARTSSKPRHPAPTRSRPLAPDELSPRSPSPGSMVSSWLGGGRSASACSGSSLSRCS